MNRERLKKAVRALVWEPNFDYHALHPTTVLKDHGDMHLDLKPDKEELPSLVRVPLRLFLPGCKVKVRPKSRVLLGFERGDPAYPVAYLWEAGSITFLEVRTYEGRKVVLDDEANRSLLSDPVKVRVEAPSIEVDGSTEVVLAGGGPALARVGDSIQVTGVQPGFGTAPGTIISGSSKARSG